MKRLGQLASPTPGGRTTVAQLQAAKSAALAALPTDPAKFTPAIMFDVTNGPPGKPGPLDYIDGCDWTVRADYGTTTLPPRPWPFRSAVWEAGKEVRKLRDGAAVLVQRQVPSFGAKVAPAYLDATRKRVALVFDELITSMKVHEARPQMSRAAAAATWLPVLGASVPSWAVWAALIYLDAKTTWRRPG